MTIIVRRNFAPLLGNLTTRRSPFKGHRYPQPAILAAVRWYCRFALSYRDVRDLLAQRGVNVDASTKYRCVQKFGPEIADRSFKLSTWRGLKWHLDETYRRAVSKWRYLQRAADQLVRLTQLYVGPFDHSTDRKVQDASDRSLSGWKLNEDGAFVGAGDTVITPDLTSEADLHPVSFDHIAFRSQATANVRIEASYPAPTTVADTFLSAVQVLDSLSVGHSVYLEFIVADHVEIVGSIDDGAC